MLDVPNKTTLPPEWQALADAYGGVGKLQEEIGLPTMTFWRLARGQVRPKPIVINLVKRLAEDKGVRSPFDPSPVAKQAPVRRLGDVDMRVLELMGDCISRGRFIPPNTLRVARESFPERELLRLAEADDMSSNVQLAVSHLLGLMDK